MSSENFKRFLFWNTSEAFSERCTFPMLVDVKYEMQKGSISPWNIKSLPSAKANIELMLNKYRSDEEQI